MRAGAAPPLRFLLLVVGGWVCVRAAMLTLEEIVPPAPAEERRATAAGPASALSRRTDPQWTAPEPVSNPPSMRRAALPVSAPAAGASQAHSRPDPLARRPMITANPAPAPSYPPAPGAPLMAAAPVPGAAEAAPSLGPPSRRRWSGSAWLHLRSGGTGQLAPGGMLGGSQIGLRLLRRINDDPARPLALSARFYVSVDRPQASEVAAGVDWRPLRALPVHLLVERRQRIGREGRSDFALTLYGGVSERSLPGGLRLDAYGQAGVVGHRTRDPFVDAAVRVSAPAGPLELGAGAWGAAQPGAARLDIGPQASIRLPIAGANLRLSTDWRFRIAGEAIPVSGPTVTLGADF